MNNREVDNKALWAIVAVGFLVRLYAYYHAYVINPDGVYYLYQAKAVSLGMWDKAMLCGYPFISIYSVLIALFYKMSGDWITAAKSVSLFFGVITIIPLYFLMKRFLTYGAVVVTTLIFAVNPVMVESSVILIKGPIFWFCSVLGFLVFTKALDSERSSLYVLSSVIFCLAVLARAEAVILFAGSLIYLVLRPGRTFRGVLVFSFPLLAVMIVSLGSMLITQGEHSLWSSYVQPRIATLSDNVIQNPFDNPMTQKLHQMHEEGVTDIKPGFFKHVQRMLWWLGVGMLFKNIINAFYLPFYIFFLIGYIGYMRSDKRDPLHAYYFLLVALTTVFVYWFVLNAWFVERRHIAVILLPSFIFIGLGVQRVIAYLHSKGVQEKIVIPLLCVSVLLVALPENLESTDPHLSGYKEIGHLIAASNPDRPALVAASSSRVIAYATIESPGLICPVSVIDYVSLTKMTYVELMVLLRSSKVDYFLWEQEQWQRASYDFSNTAKAQDFAEKGRWQIEGAGYILYEVLNP
ncbi:MAG: glycosyltransferase family 39 protein [Nitrospira sp.]|nr:glycosyltransferase family 39 protein [Nitrospira sp.]